MGNSLATRSTTAAASEKTNGTGGGGGGVLLFLHRTWEVIVTEKWSRSRARTRRHSRNNRNNAATNSDSLSDYGSQYSQYSFCSCSQCQRDDGFSSGCDSELFESGSSMAPNSEESTRVEAYPYTDDSFNKDKQRPPVYNPEDYALSLRKWGRKPPNGGPPVALYPVPGVAAIATTPTKATTISTAPSRQVERSRTKGKPTSSPSFRDYRNPMLVAAGSEMTLRQFSTVPELLAKLKADLRLAYPSFVQEFVGDPLDGVTLILDLLRAVQLSQSNSGHHTTGSNSTGKVPPSLQRRTLLDELSCLQCLLLCCQRYPDSIRRLTASSAGLFTLAICIMSNVTKSRILALELLTKACKPQNDGHSAVSESLSTLRLRFGEPVRFRFLVGMLMSAGGQGDLLAAGMRFLNSFLDTAGSAQKRLYIQAELEQAGFDIVSIKRNISINSTSAERIFEELDHWEKKHLDVEMLTIRLENTERENDSLRDKVLLLERRVQILLEEKGILVSLEQCLKERCSELQEEVLSLKSEKSQKNSSCGSTKKKADSPNEDEGISSSDRSFSPEEDDVQHNSSEYEIYSVQGATLPLPPPKAPPKPPRAQKEEVEEEDEETTIEEVMEELRNIINDAETEAYKSDEKKKQQKKEEAERRRIEEAQIASKIRMRVDVDDFAVDHELEIVPSNLHPQPPRRTRSLVHLFVPSEDYDYGNNGNGELFFENETAYTSEEGSDSLLSASKYQLPRLEQQQQQQLKEKENEKQEEELSYHQQNHHMVKRSESFKYHVTKPPVKKQSSCDGSYYYNTPLTITNGNNNNKNNAAEEQHARLKSKSLDRIDDGLDTMVDIVVTDHRIISSAAAPTTTNLDDNGTSLPRSIASVFGHQRKFNGVSPSEEKLKMFLPQSNSRDNGNGEVPYYFPRLQEKKSNSFLIKRGHVNAGLYSGQVRSENYSNMNNRGGQDYVPIGHCRANGKFTDLPSGLY